ncbi:hypothetical protein [Bacillus phage SBSphiJ5]|nr:hypothetical protein [Bacillus phage SBSphiJ5]
MKTIQPGDVIFYRPTGFIGWAISKITKSEYSHVALVVSPDHIIEANRFIKSRIADLHYTKEIHSVYRLNNLPADTRLRIINNALTMLDVSYDYSQIFGLLLRLVFDIKTNVFNKVNRYICSEIIDNAFVAAGVPRKDKENIGDITPQELLDKYDLRKVI